MEGKSYFKTLPEQQQNLFREWGRLFALSNNPPPSDEEIGTVVMPTGDWLDRLRPSLSFFESRFASQKIKPQLVITGENSFNIDREGVSAPRIVSRLKKLDIPDEMKTLIIAESKGTNTKGQAEEIYGMLKNGLIQEPVVIVVSAYHLPRIYSTFIKEVFKQEGNQLHTRVFVIPVQKDWKGEIPFEIGRTRRDRIVPEVERIHRYRLQGDVASEEQLDAYTTWLSQKAHA